MRKPLLILIGVIGCVALVFGQGPTPTNPGIYWVPPSACTSSVSGGGTGTNGQTTAGASGTPVVQAQVDNMGSPAYTATFICVLNPPQAIVTSRVGFAVQDAVFFYGEQTTALGTQANVLASGTFNGSIVFSSITYPTAAASQTASTVTPVRADSGTLVIAPVLASLNKGLTTAGAFYSVKFTPATPITWKADLKELLLTVTLVTTASSATVINSPGVLVHTVTR